MCHIDIVIALILQDMMSASLAFHLIREHLIGLVHDLDQDKSVKSHTLFVLLIKKLVSIVNICHCQNYSTDLQRVSHFMARVHALLFTIHVHTPYLFLVCSLKL